MNPHLYFQELMAAAIDFELSEDERGQLNAHLAGCPECRRWGALFRADAGAIAGEPAPVLPVIRSRAILRAALRPARTGPPIRLLAVAAMLTTLGGALLIGGIGLVDDDPTESPRIALPSTSPPASVVPSDEPGSTRGPTVRPTRPPAPSDAPPVTAPSAEPPVAAMLPIRASADGLAMTVRMEPDGLGNLFVSIGGDGNTVLAFLGSGGVPVQGWPIRIEHADGCVPKAADDGTVRLLCFHSDDDPECVDVCGEIRAYAYDATGSPLDNWPIAFPTGLTSGVDVEGARLMGTTLVLAAYDEGEDAGQDRAWLFHVEENGAILPGVAAPGVSGSVAIAPNGIAYGRSVDTSDDGQSVTTVVAFDQRGIRPGWPVQLPGMASPLAFTPDGAVETIVADGDGQLDLVTIGEDGVIAPRGPSDIPFDQAGLDVWGEHAPIVLDDNSTYVLGDGRVARIDAAGNLVPGWPYEPATSYASIEGDCPPGDTGCFFHNPPPVVGPDGILYALEEPAGDGGGSVVAIDPDGGVRDGWPVTLRRSGAEFWGLVAGPERIAYVLAVEPEPDGRSSSATILAIDQASTVVYRATIIEPAQ
ncbi:MAG TPA: zf-HC2 domain-containing protein [Clostridia bacterium]|nr:zf-HC2 domain-containing protein [Clostridia bacterium]